jgi:hypothetical protein
LQNAYIEIAIYGYGFCSATMRVTGRRWPASGVSREPLLTASVQTLQAFKLLASNLLRVITLNTVTMLILFVCKLLVIAATGIFAYTYIRNDEELNEDLHYRGAVVFFTCIIAYFIADLFMDVYDMTIDTMFLCFAEDTDRNDGKVPDLRHLHACALPVLWVGLAMNRVAGC